MNVRCPECNSVFRVDPEKVPISGVRARCARCSAIFSLNRSGVAAGIPSTSIESSSGGTAPATRTADVPAGPEAESGSGSAGATPAPAAASPSSANTEAGGPAAVASGQGAPAQAISTQSAPGQLAAKPASPDPESGRLAAPGPISPGPAGFTGNAPARPVTATAAAPPRPVAPASPARPAGSPKRASFAKLDPNVRAQRLARALVSDIVAYNKDKREAALQAGTLKNEFREEIRKSWEEYVAQVGLDLARGTPFFRDSLNEILAKGQSLF